MGIIKSCVLEIKNLQRLVTRRIDLVRSMQTEVAVVQSESSDSPWTSGSAANQKGGARSQRGQPRQIKCWTCIYPRKSSPSTSAGASLSTCATTPAPISQRSRGAFSRRGDLLLQHTNPGEAALSLGFKQESKQTSKHIKSVCLTQEPGVMTALAGGLPRMMRPSPHQNYPRGGYSLEGNTRKQPTLEKFNKLQRSASARQ